MFNSKKIQDASGNVNLSNINTLIDEGCLIKGDVSVKNSIKIEGTIQGNLNVDGSIIVGKKGVVKGDIHCADLLVFGRVEGDIHAHQLQLKQTAHIQGDIETRILQIDSGANYQGSVTMKTDAIQTTPPPPKKS